MTIFSYPAASAIARNRLRCIGSSSIHMSEIAETSQSCPVGSAEESTCPTECCSDSPCQERTLRGRASAKSEP
eukprot:2979986-Prymnesium_polylepis.1